MELRKRIGVIAGKLYKEINQEYLDGVLQQAKALGFQVFVFTLAEENHNAKIIEGEENLFSAINFSLFDGIVYIPYTISSPTYWDFIERFLVKHCTIPVVRIGTEKENFIQLWHDERAEAREITEHLIHDHGCRRIHCLTGLDYMEVSHNRLAGYKDAMEAAGLPYSDDDITFGDFWIFKSQELAKEIAEGKREKPDAVVCANDVMAIALCDALTEKGYAVPDDVKIIGYDGGMETRIHVPPVSTYQPSWTQLGRDAMCLLYRTLTGKEIEPCGYSKPKFWKRESCGCKDKSDSMMKVIFDYQRLEDNYMDATLATDLHMAVNLEDFVEQLYNHTSVFMTEQDWGGQIFSLCLCENWNQVQLKGYTTEYRTKGYSERMTLIDRTGSHITFPLSEMFPQSTDDETAVFYFTPVHFLERCFGYAVLKRTDGIPGFNAHYLRYLRELNNGLGFLCIRNEAKTLAYQSYISSLRDQLTGLYKLEGGAELWKNMGQQADQHGEMLYLIGVHLKNFYKIEESAGVLVQNKLLVDFVDMLRSCCRNGEKCIRLNNHEFIAVGIEITPFQHHTEFEKTLAERYATVFGDYELMNEVELFSTSLVTVTSDDFMDTAGLLFQRLQSHVDKTYPNPDYYFKLLALREAFFQQPEKEWTLEACSGMLNVSQPYFQKLYRSTFGQSWHLDMQRGKILYAVHLLVATNEKMETIAEKCGYDYSHFMRMFKKLIGMTPNEFRKTRRSRK